jgi:hypothetical protein
MKRQWLDMRYNRNCGYWFVMEEGQTSFMFHGEWFDLYITEERSIPCRLEYSKRWILIMGSLRLHLRTQDVYKVEV